MPVNAINAIILCTSTGYQKNFEEQIDVVTIAMIFTKYFPRLQISTQSSLRVD